MTIQRAVVKGRALDLVETRSMYTCDVTESGGDTYSVLWAAYLQSIYDAFEVIWASSWSTQLAELQNYDAGHWVTFAEIPFVNAGGNSTHEVLANVVSFVLVGKALGLRKLGRKFIGGITEAAVLGNTLIANAMIYAVNALEAYIAPFTGIGGGTIVPGIVDAGGTFRPFVGGFVSSLLGTMRRRKPGVGF